MKTFNLTFAEALEVLKDDSKYVQGENFGEDVILYNLYDEIKAKDLVTGAYTDKVALCVSLYTQMYRIVEII
jgi:hypothetical protein